MATSVIGNPNAANAEIGEIKMWSGITVPSKWIACDGGVVSRTTYRDLFEVIGTEFGGGDGETTFAIPDFRGRSPVGVGESSATGHTAHTRGQMDGEEFHVLTSDELASHSHPVVLWQSKGVAADHPYHNFQDYNQTKSWWNGDYSYSTYGTGSNTPHNTMQPYTSVNFIIYTNVE